MPRFSYQSRDGKGQSYNGIVTATSIAEAGQNLRAEGKFVTKIRELAAGEEANANAATASPSAAGAPVKLKGGRIKRDDVIFFANQMAIMIETGVPISEALTSISDQTTNAAFKAVLDDVAQAVQGGGDLSTALRKYPKVFPAIMTSLIKASEVSGTMGQMLDRISRYMAKEAKTLKQIKGALMYPAFMVTMAISVTVFLLTFVLPKFAAIYSSRQAALPAPTRFLLTTSDLMINYWYYWILGAGAVVGSIIFANSTPTGRRFFDNLKLSAPIFKKLFTALYVSRSTRTIGTMLQSGVAVLDCVAIVKMVTTNSYYEELWDKVDEELKTGKQLSDPLAASPLFPKSIVQMIRSGEKSGRLAQVMNRVADFTESEFDDIVKATTQFIEPVMMVVMGSIIGFVAIALLLPIFSVSRVVSG